MRSHLYQGRVVGWAVKVDGRGWGCGPGAKWPCRRQVVQSAGIEAGHRHHLTGLEEICQNATCAPSNNVPPWALRVHLLLHQMQRKSCAGRGRWRGGLLLLTAPFAETLKIEWRPFWGWNDQREVFVGVSGLHQRIHSQQRPTFHVHLRFCLSQIYNLFNNCWWL